MTETSPAPAPTVAKNPTVIHIVDDAPIDGNNWNWSRFESVFKKPEDYPTGEPLYCEVELPGTPLVIDYHGKASRRKVRVSVWGDHVFLGFDGWYSKNGRGHNTREVDPFVAKVEALGQSYERTVTRNVRQSNGRGHTFYTGHHTSPQTFTDCYWHPAYKTHHHYDHDLPPEGQRVSYRWVRYRFTLEDGTTFEAEFKNEMPLTGKASVADDGAITCEAEFFGHQQTWTHETLAFIERQIPRSWGGGYDTQWNDPLAVLLMHLRGSEITDGVLRWWTVFLSLQPGSKTPDTKGIASVLNKKANKPCFEKLAADFPAEWAFLQWLMSGKTSQKFQNNKFLAAMFADNGFNADKIAAEARKVMESPPNGVPTNTYRDKEVYFEARRSLCEAFGAAAEVIREVEAKTDFSKRKTNSGKADGLGIDADRYPKLRAAVEAGDIPASVFANPDKSPVNREFAIWERALNQPGWEEEILKISQDAGRRSTYEKDITPYLAFILFKLPRYMDRHVEGKKKWSCKPRYVESEWDLEMGEEAAGGTTKRRSAFTPVADNDTRVVEVPYVAVCVTGRVSQWCYSKHYHVFEEGMIDPVSGGVVVNEVEEKLNGRDDYGLMFYTLNGTATAQGYPTFLIIFERRKAGTFVHFHRVHPKRKKDGQWTPACDLVERVYQYMAGNIPASDVRAQQGDMVYIKHPMTRWPLGAKVEDQCKAARGLVFESHNHVALGDGEVKLWISEAKTPANRLGFMEVPEGGMAVRHPEHDDIDYLEAGWYEVRRCRSWEANPRAIWSLTID